MKCIVCKVGIMISMADGSLCCEECGHVKKPACVAHDITLFDEDTTRQNDATRHRIATTRR